MQIQLPRALLWLLLGVAVAAAVWYFWDILSPFLIAAVLAYMLQPAVAYLDRATRGRLPKILWVSLVELLFLCAVVGLFLLLVPIVTREIPLIQQKLPGVLEGFQTQLNPWLDRLGLNLSLDMGSVKAQLAKYFSANKGTVLDSVLSGGSLALSVLANIVLIPVLLFYFLYDWERLAPLVPRLLPHAWQPAYQRMIAEVDEVLGHYMRGQLLVMLILALFYSTALLIAGLELAFPVGVFTGLAVFIPYLGFGVGLILALLAALLQWGLFKALAVVGGIYAAGQIMESSFLTPRLVGERIGLHPLAVLFSLLAFGQLFGFVGIMIALPLAATLAVVARHLYQVYLERLSRTSGSIISKADAASSPSDSPRI